MFVVNSNAVATRTIDPVVQAAIDAAQTNRIYVRSTRVR